MVLRDWLQLFRAHTAPSTILFVFALYVVGGGELYSIRFLLVIVAAIAFHWLGFGHNSLMDYTAGYDKEDPHKEHFPLVAGRIKLETAHNVVHTLMILGSLYVVIITYFYATNPVLALMSFVMTLTFGHAYNDGMGKTTSLKFIPLSLYAIAFGSWAYFFVSLEITKLYVLIILYVFLVAVYEIAYEGELKEILFTKEANLLRASGVRVIGNRIYISNTAKVLSYSLCALKLLVMLLVLNEITSFEPSTISIITIVGTLFFQAFSIYSAHKITISRVYDHDEDLENCAKTEIGAIFSLVIALTPICGVVGIIMIALSMCYYVAFNKYMWKTTIRPQV